ncbi:NHL repeat-containing protein [Govanella unica]|uniref:Regulatory protein FlaEY n=1 Tax=Govanella unica TaxID=2975056 RepID=A0A9X3TVX3_9PROT|nr:hypothetical protein [Govania unica]MDA5192638.1 hypothetical protein [Govania unica]
MATISSFSLIQLDSSLLTAHYQAQQATRGVGSLPAGSVSKLNSKPPTAQTPWNQLEDKTPLERRITALKTTQNFINSNSSNAKLAGDNKDAKALFTLYEALVKLKDIADYASDKNRTDTVRSTLDILMQKGLSQIKDFMQTTDLNLLDLVYGSKSNKVQTQIGVGKNASKFIGRSLLTSSKEAAISGVSPSDRFTVTISKSGETRDFDIDLSEISGPISLQAIADLVNSKIEAETTTNALGETVSKYTTRFNVEKIDNTHYSLALSGLTGEKVSLTAAVAEPSLFVVGTSKANDKAVTTGTLTRLDGLDNSDPTRGFRDSIAGQGTTLLEVNDKTAATDPLNGRTNATIEKIRQSVTDLYKELDIETNKTDSSRPNTETTASAVAVDSEGHVFVIGNSAGDFGHEVNRSDGSDVYLTKYDAAGNVVWQHLLGANGTASGYGITIDSNDNVIIAGSVNGTLTGNELFKGTDSFVTKFSNSGDQLWTKQIDSYADDSAFAVAVDADNNVYITGQTKGAFTSGLTPGGSNDMYVAKLSGSKGNILAASQFGTADSEVGKAIAVTDDGNILVASEENGRAIVRKLDSTDLTTVLWEKDLGSLGSGSISGIAVEGTNIYLAGSTTNSSFGGGTVTNPQSGASDGFVLRLDDGGTDASVAWTNFVGTSGSDYITGIAASGGQVYVSGRTSGQMGAESKTGSTDAFAGKIDGMTGSTAWIEQMGGLTGANGATGIAISSNGSSVLSKLGLGPGSVQVTEDRTLMAQTTLRAGDYFYLSVNGGQQQKIVIREGDTFERLASRINTASFRNIKAETVIGGPEGRRLKISAINGGEIKIMSGSGDKDALKSLGIEPTTIISTDKLYNLNTGKNGKAADLDLGGLFGLNFEAGLTTSTMNGSKYLAGKLADAIAQMQRAYRSLYHDPTIEALKNNAKKTSGTVPAHLQKQLANYKDGLSRLMSSGGMNI